jgi:hypothetical protein
MNKLICKNGRELKAGCALATGLFLTACSSPAPEPPKPSRLGVYSTAYLTEENLIINVPQVASKPAPPKPAPKRDWSWQGDGVIGAPSIVIDLSDQKATFYKAGNAVGFSTVSTGREGFSTPSGNFRVIQKNQNHVSSLYGDFVNAEGNVVVSNVDVTKDKCPAGAKFKGAPMPFFMRVNGAVGMHAGFLPGYPASHGCIRMPRGAAQRFFENAPEGTPVRIVH